MSFSVQIYILLIQIEAYSLRNEVDAVKEGLRSRLRPSLYSFLAISNDVSETPDPIRHSVGPIDSLYA